MKMIKVEQVKFKRHKSKWEVFCDILDKEYGLVYDKRVLLENLTTIPYGYN